MYLSNVDKLKAIFEVLLERPIRMSDNVEDDIDELYEKVVINREQS